MKFNEVVAGVKLLGEVSWSTLSVEQAHASVTLVRLQHPRYELNTVLVRAGLHTLRMILPSPSRQEKKLRQLMTMLDQLNQNVVSKISGNHMFLKITVEDIVKLAERDRKSITLLQARSVIKEWCNVASAVAG